MSKVIYYQSWEESEAGWGTRPDGFSLHKSQADCKDYIQQYWARQPRGPAPHEYSRDCGSPKPIEATDGVVKLITGKGLRVEQWNAKKLFKWEGDKIALQTKKSV